MPQFPCPSCAGPIKFQSAVSLTAVCPYCRTLALRDDLKLKDLGKVAQLLQDGTPVQIGATGEHYGVSFVVLGRLQLDWGEGAWNEWHLGFNDGRLGWLGEGQGRYSVMFRAETKVRLDGLKIDKLRGLELPLEGGSYRVTDVKEAVYASAEGELPFQAPIGRKAVMADLQGPGARCGTIDFSEDKPVLFLGRHAEFDELKLSGLRAIEGW